MAFLISSQCLEGGFFFCLPVDNSDDKDGFLEQVFVLFVTMSAQQEAGSWIMGPLWERG